MSNFTTYSYETKREIFKFCAPFFSVLRKPAAKFCSDMIFGILSSQSILISEIGRGLHESIDIRHTHKRLEYQLSKFTIDDEEVFQAIYDYQVKRFLNEHVVLVVDDSEIAKNDGTKFEHIGRVRDASADKIRDGYHMCEIVLLTGDDHHPVKVYSHIYSEKEPGFISANEETKKGLLHCIELLDGKEAVFVMDRGYDNIEWYRFFKMHNQHFVIRQKSTRNVIYKKKTINIAKLTRMRKGKVRFDTSVKGKKVTLYCSHVNIALPAMKGTKLNMVFTNDYAKDGMMLLTDIDIKGKAELLYIMKLYALRWKIEEKFRFEKGIYDLEDIRVRSLRRINLMNMFMNYAILILANLIREKEERELSKKILKSAKGIKKNIRNFYYRMANGIKEILAHDTKGMKVYYRIQHRRIKQMQLAI